eukprot:365907-Chlamydomonas_euryale.AAC.5
MSPAQVQGLFAATDTDHDGTITLEEFKAALHLATMGAEEDNDVLDAPASAGALPASAGAWPALAGAWAKQDE